MKFQQRLKIIIPIVLLAAVLMFAAWYFVNWYKPSGAVIPGAPMELMRIVQNDREIRIIKKGKEEVITIPEGKPYKYEIKYTDKVFMEQVVVVNGVKVKGTYRNENGFPTVFPVTFRPGEKQEYTLSLQMDWQVEKHRLLDRYRGKSWKANLSLR